MVITQNDVKNDFHVLISSINDGDKTLVRRRDALKISMLWPVSSVVGYFISMVWLSMTYQPYVNHFDNIVTLFDEYKFALGFGAISFILALFIGFSLYVPALAYLSVGNEVRNKSLILNNLKCLVIKLGVITLLANISLAVVTVFIPYLLVVAPFMMMITFVIMQMIISAEIGRYGLGLVFSKLCEIAKKI